MNWSHLIDLSNMTCHISVHFQLDTFESMLRASPFLNASVEGSLAFASKCMTAPQVLTLDEGRTASGRCFDPDYYRALNPDLGALPNDALFLHFERFGRFEARAFLLTECPPSTVSASLAESDLDRLIPPTM